MSQEPSGLFEAEYHMAWMCRDLAADPHGTYMLVQVALNRLRPKEEKNPTTVNIDEFMDVIKGTNLRGNKDKSHWAKEALYIGLILQTPSGRREKLWQVWERQSSFEDTTASSTIGASPSKQMDTCVRNAFIIAWTLPYGNETNSTLHSAESGFLFAYMMSPEQRKISEALIVWKSNLRRSNGVFDLRYV